MPVDNKNQGKFPPPKIKPCVANSIGQAIVKKAAGPRASQTERFLRLSIAHALNASEKKVTRLINNTGQPPTMQELATIAQVLEVTIDQLIKLEE